MSVGVYIKDFGHGEPGFAAVDRRYGHTLLVIDAAVPLRQRYDILLEKLTDDEITELWELWSELTVPPPKECCQDGGTLCQQ